MKLQFLIVVVILMSFAAADDGSKQLDSLCKADDEKIKQMEPFVKPMRECMREVQPIVAQALSACNTKVYGTDPQTAADAKKAFCPKDDAKMAKLGECLKGQGIKEPSREEQKNAMKEMNKCLGEKAN